MQTYKLKKGQNIATFSNSLNLPLSLGCGGNGRCGKCKVKIHEGSLEITDLERHHLTSVELQQGIRLACLHKSIEEDIVFSIVEETNTLSIVGAGKTTFSTKGEVGYAIAIDIGTTTVAMDLINLETGIVEKEISFVNPQRIYGFDVITRIDQTQKLGVEQLQKILLEAIEKEIKTLSTYSLKRLVVCGNPTMTHIFMGVDPISIATAPYTCKEVNYVEYASKQLFPTINQTFKIQVLPPINAYVGSDVVMGIYAYKLLEKDEKSLFIDLGTNGELAVFDKHTILTTSAACGPAFEGGNMVCGIGAVDGAIAEVSYKGTWQYKTIRDKEAVGICGSGYMSMISQAYQHGFIDESGYLEKELSLLDQVALYQSDVREFQMAKSAIAAAIVCACHALNLKFDELDRVYVAGGFGKHVALNDLFTLGILPKRVASKLQVIGNSAAQGVIEYAIQQDLDKVMNIVEKSKSILLANNPQFTDVFMKNMMFGDIHEN